MVRVSVLAASSHFEAAINLKSEYWPACPKQCFKASKMRGWRVPALKSAFQAKKRIKKAQEYLFKPILHMLIKLVPALNHAI